MTTVDERNDSETDLEVREGLCREDQTESNVRRTQ